MILRPEISVDRPPTPPFMSIHNPLHTMSRASTSVLGAVAKSAATPRLARSFRTIPGARPPKAGSAGQAVDYRIFQGIDGFLGEKEFSRLNEWQGGLWERLQAEVNSTLT
jgi:Fe-Mn family superoxide dismutase